MAVNILSRSKGSHMPHWPMRVSAGSIGQCSPSRRVARAQRIAHQQIEPVVDTTITIWFRHTEEVPVAPQPLPITVSQRITAADRIIQHFWTIRWIQRKAVLAQPRRGTMATTAKYNWMSSSIRRWTKISFGDYLISCQAWNIVTSLASAIEIPIMPPWHTAIWMLPNMRGTSRNRTSLPQYANVFHLQG